MRLTANQADMLYRCALAEFFTSPTTPATYDRKKVYLEIFRLGLIDKNGAGVTLTDVGRSALGACITDAQRATLAQLTEHRSNIQARRCK